MFGGLSPKHDNICRVAKDMRFHVDHVAFNLVDPRK